MVKILTAPLLRILMAAAAAHNIDFSSTSPLACHVMFQYPCNTYNGGAKHSLDQSRTDRNNFRWLFNFGNIRHWF